MKTSKRSLIASIAVLCVCALSLSTATFAWFTAAENAMVDDIILKVQAQSDIKISADSAATANSGSDLWKTTLVQTDFKDANAIEEYISDVTPKTNNICDGNFQVPEVRDDVVVDTGDYEGTLVDTAEGWAEFTVYVRTTKLQDVNLSFSDFEYIGTGTASVVDALRLGVKAADGTVTNGSYTGVVVKSGDLTAFADGNGYYGAVTFCVWVEGKDPACVNKNALSLKEYKFDLNFAYAA